MMPAIYDRNADAGIFFGRGSEAGWYSVAQKPRCQKTLQMTGEWLNTTGADQQSPELVADAFALLSCPTPETGKSKFPRSRRFHN